VYGFDDRDVYIVGANIKDDLAPCGACRPWIFFINEVLCFLKNNSSGMEKEEK